MGWRYGFRLVQNKRWVGFTLVETLVAMGLFSIILTMVGQIARDAFFVQKRGVASQELLRNGAIACDSLGRELRQCEAIAWPTYSDWSTGRTVAFTAGSNSVIALRVRWGTSASTTLVGYRYWGATGKLERCVYKPEQKLNATALLSNNAVVSSKELMPVVRDVKFWSCKQTQRYGQSVLGFSFYALPSAKGLKTSAQQGVHFETEVQVKGM